MNNKQAGTIKYKLYKYFEDEKQIVVLKEKFNFLKEQYQVVNEQVRENKFPPLDTGVGAIGFEERVQSSSSGDSNFEKQFLNQCDKALEEMNYIVKKQEEIKRKIRQIERNNFILKMNFENLTTEKKQLLECKYRDKKTLEEIYLIINRGSTTTSKLHNELIEEVARWLENE